MNSEIVRRHNERVNEDDIVFFLGDLGFYASALKEHRGEGSPTPSLQLLSQMKGLWYRINGNHDKRSNKTHVPIKSINLEIAGLRVQLIHDPAEADIENNQLIIHGHQHSKFKTKEILNKRNVPVFFINVSVENTDYYPLTWDEVKAIYDRWLSGHPQRKIINRDIIKGK
jgi:calcineurin-like phosphoesterase family protein